MAEPDFKFNILPEEESSTDAFEDGAHRKIADSLFNIITTQEHSANIGLSGEWGSGKSTVIRMLKEKMDKDNLFFIFDSWANENDSLRIDFLLEFIHELVLFLNNKNKKLDIEKIKELIKEKDKNELLSRIIKKNKNSSLRKNSKKKGIIRRNLIKENNIIIDNIKKQEDIISGKTKSVKKTDKKVYSILGLLFIFCVSLTILGSKIIDFILQDNNEVIKKNFLYDINFYSYFLTAPFILFCVIYRQRIFRNIFKIKIFEKVNDSIVDFIAIIISLIIDIILLSVCATVLKINVVFVVLYYIITSFIFTFGIFWCKKEILFSNIGIYNDDLNESIIQIEENLAISNYAYEFRSKFIEIIKILLCYNKFSKIKVVIVLDNLDRMSTSKALELWTVMQIFMQRKKNPDKMDDENSKCLDHVWFIVPYDEIAILRLWKNNFTDERNNNEKTKINHLSQTETHSTDVSNEEINNNCESSISFLEKSFQIRIDVPAPLASSWIDFTKKMLDRAFGNSIKDNEKDNIIKLLFVSLESLNQAITPREIKSFINQVGIYYQTYRMNNISLISVAYYILFRYFSNKQFNNDKMIQRLIKSFYHDKNIEEDFLAQNHMIYLCNCDYIKEISGIIFGCTPTKGIEILSEKMFEKEIIISNFKDLKRKINRIRKISELNIPVDSDDSNESANNQDKKEVFYMLINKYCGGVFDKCLPSNIIFLINIFEELKIQEDKIPDFYNFLNFYFSKNSKCISNENYSHSFYRHPMPSDAFEVIVKRAKKFCGKKKKVLESFCKYILKYAFEQSLCDEESIRDKNGNITQKNTIANINIPDILEKYFIAMKIFEQEVKTDLEINDNLLVHINRDDELTLIFSKKWKEEYYNLSFNLVLPFNEPLLCDEKIYSLVKNAFLSLNEKSKFIHPLMKYYVETVRDNPKWEKAILSLINQILHNLDDKVGYNNSYYCLLIVFVSYKMQYKKFVYENFLKKINDHCNMLENDIEKYCDESYCFYLFLSCLCFNEMSYTEKIKKYILPTKNIVLLIIKCFLDIEVTEKLNIDLLCYSIWNMGQENDRYIMFIFYSLMKELAIPKFESWIKSILTFSHIENKEGILKNIENIIGIKFEQKIYDLLNQ